METLDKLETCINGILDKNAALRAELRRVKEANDGLATLQEENEGLKKELELEKQRTKTALERVEQILTRLKEQADLE